MQTTSAVTIANGESQSNVVDLTDMALIGITMPSAWTAAAITLLAADTQGGTYTPVHDSGGTEISFTVAQSRHVTIDPDVTRSLRFVKLRSGNTAVPVNQGAARTFAVTVERTGGA